MASKQRRARRSVEALAEVVRRIGGDPKKFAAPFMAAECRLEKRKREQFRRTHGK